MVDSNRVDIGKVKAKVNKFNNAADEGSSQIYRIFPGKSGAKDDRNVGIHCVTMNCGGQSPGSLEDLLPIFEVRD